MARIARVVAEGLPYHIIQRGNRRQQVFFDNEDRLEYLRLLKEQGQNYGLEYWAYCLMDNHVHLIVVPSDNESFRALAEAHRRYTRRINFKKGWRGYLWQGRFMSYPLDERYLYAAMRYVERNPVRAKMVDLAWEYEWSSAKSHVEKKEDHLISVCFLQNEIKDWKEYLMQKDEQIELIRKHGNTGRPLGDREFVEGLEQQLQRSFFKQKPGPKRNA